MKKMIINCIVVLILGLSAQQISLAQGTITYLSSLSQTSTGSHSVGSDSWLAADFETGANASGYVFNSVQLALIDASGNPSGFTVMLYTEVGAAGANPGSSLGSLSGSLNPAIGGIFTYTSTTNLTLSPSTDYFVVLTAVAAVANGAYNWSDSAFPPNSSDGWRAANGVLHSNNGISGWSPTPYLGIAQFAINATAVPEPGVLGLFGLGGLGFLWHRRKAKAL